jgi:two-component system alkaline phosphatase synthesis response regulator PhoP
MTDKKKILAVDDEPDVLMIVRMGLMSEGYEVDTATNGFDALAKAKENCPDLVVLDMMMPEMTGFEVLKHLRNHESTRNVPVIMLTGVADRARIQQALDAGINFYIVKPFNLHDLLAKVKLAMDEATGGGIGLPPLV